MWAHYADMSDDWTMTWHDDWTLTWHADWTLTRLLTVYTGVMMTSSLSGSVAWVGSSGIRVGSGHSGEEDACDAWRASVRVVSNLAGA